MYLLTFVTVVLVFVVLIVLYDRVISLAALVLPFSCVIKVLLLVCNSVHALRGLRPKQVAM